MNAEQKIRKLAEALEPFARMDREGGDRLEVACQRGTASDLTIITSEDFRQAFNSLVEVGCWGWPARPQGSRG